MTRPAPHRRPGCSRALFAILLAVAPVSTSVPSQALAADATSLLGNLKRLAEVEHGCKVNAPWASPALCRDAAEAFRRRFRGEGVPYTPGYVEPFPSQPRETPSAPSKPHRKPAPLAAASRPSPPEGSSGHCRRPKRSGSRSPSPPRSRRTSTVMPSSMEQHTATPSTPPRSRRTCWRPSWSATARSSALVRKLSRDPAAAARRRRRALPSQGPARRRASPSRLSRAATSPTQRRAR